MIKLKDILIEKKELGGAAINVIDTLTDRNNHNIARQQLAWRMKNKKLEKSYEAIEALNIALGHLPSELSKLRNKLDKELFAQAKKMYSDYDAISGAF
tara:strand:+ start:669 stop:962 length:294 start_codon:yes stop_codon:yes gene_type:complete